MTGKLILVIDDDPDVLDVMNIVLTKGGFDVVTAGSGNDGIAAFTARRPALVLCDMMMESIDEGLQVASTLKRLDASIPVLLVSSVGDSAQGTMPMLDLGFDGAIQKPIEPTELIATVRRKLGL